VELDLHRLFRIARRWWWLLALCVVLGGSFAYVTARQQVPLYSASSTVLINPVGDTASLASTIQTGEKLAPTYSLWILSAPVLERVNTELIEAGVGGLLGNVSTQVISNSLFIRISVTDSDPYRAALTANVVAEQFIQYVQEQSTLALSQRKAEIDGQVELLNQQISDTEARITDLQNQTNISEEQMEALQDNRNVLLEDLSRLQLSARSIDAEIASTENQLVLSSPAREPTVPFAPQIRRTVFLGVLGGGLLAVGAIALLEYFDNRVRTREEVQALTSAPVLATVSTHPVSKSGQGQLFSLESPRSTAAESLRLLRANIEFTAATSPISALAISSPGSGEGKSLITANLGVVMARAGLKTVIIDADLRRPSQHRIFNIENYRGLTTLLKHPNEDWHEAAIPSIVPGLTILPSGPIPPNPSELLLLGRFGEILSQIREATDIVLLDTSPVLAVSDSLIVTSQTNGVLLVCQSGKTRRDRLQQAAAAFAQADIRLVGVVMSQQDSELIEGYNSHEH
jgi:capsular exopolysaccharide synthesis family protein